MAACQCWICSPCCKSCVYGICAFVLRCFFFCSQTVLQMEHSLGVKIFFSSSLSSCKSCIFLNTLSPVLSTPLSYVCCVCMDRLMANFAGTCTSDNKGLLHLLFKFSEIISQPLTSWASPLTRKAASIRWQVQWCIMGTWCLNRSSVKNRLNPTALKVI